MNDTANEVSSLEELLETAIKRALIAIVVIESHKDALLPTILEDLFCGCQIILDTYCVKVE